MNARLEINFHIENGLSCSSLETLSNISLVVNIKKQIFKVTILKLALFNSTHEVQISLITDFQKNLTMT